MSTTPSSRGLMELQAETQMGRDSGIRKFISSCVCGTSDRMKSISNIGSYFGEFPLIFAHFSYILLQKIHKLTYILA